jgi:hypothetical protein
MSSDPIWRRCDWTLTNVKQSVAELRGARTTRNNSTEEACRSRLVRGE